MSGNRFNAYSDLEIGVGLRAPHLEHILSRKPDVGWFEIISENHLVDGGEPLHRLDRILEQYRVVQHGVGLYVGSAQGVDREHLRRLKALVRRTGTPWVTDHLCWGSVDGAYSHDLLPLPYTREAIARAVENIKQAMSRGHLCASDAGRVSEWFGRWTARGWLTRPQAASPFRPAQGRDP